MITSATQFLLFRFQIQEKLLNDTEGNSLAWIFAIGFLAMVVELIRHGCESNTKSIYSYKRLLISEKGVFYCQTAYNITALMIFWAIEAITLYFLCYYSVFIKSYSSSEFTIFLAFYRNSFLHSIIPMSELSAWIRNVVLLISLGFATAEFPFKQRRKKFAATTFILSFFTVFYFKTDFGNTVNTILTITISLICLGEVLFFVYDNYNTEVSENERN